MPNFYTHLRFGTQVAARLSLPLATQLRQQWDSYLLGNFGPDPLYFCGKKLRQAGLSIHNHTGAQAMERYRTAITLDKPYALSFAAGYFLHFFLDSQMHPVIYQAMNASGLTHQNLEGELDRLFLQRDHVSPSQAFPHHPMPESFYMTAARMIPGVTPMQYRDGVENFRRISLALTASAGTPLRYAVNGLGRIPKIHGIHGAILPPSPSQDARHWLWELQRCYLKARNTAPDALEDFLQNAKTGKAFSPLLSQDFSGRKDV